MGIGRDFSSGDCARTRAPTDSLLCVLANDRSQVEAEDQGRATARVPWGWCWRQVAKSRRHLGADIYLARLNRGNDTPGRGSVYAQARVGRESSMCVCNQDTSVWLSPGKRKWLYLEAGAEPRGAL